MAGEGAAHSLALYKGSAALCLDSSPAVHVAGLLHSMPARAFALEDLPQCGQMLEDDI